MSTQPAQGYQAIILAAGMGTRMQKYTASCHKALLPLQGKTLLEWQIQHLHSLGVNDIFVVVGYSKEQFNVYVEKFGVTLIENTEFANTNMVTSMYCAYPFINKPVLLCYGDIWYQPNALQMLIEVEDPNALAVDGNWQGYWQYRYGKVAFDLEELLLTPDEYVIALGKETEDPSRQQKRYVGLIKFSYENFHQGYQTWCDDRHEGWEYCKTTPQKSYMTDLLNILIKFSDAKFKGVDIGRRWLEFDTVEDYELSLEWDNLVAEVGLDSE